MKSNLKWPTSWTPIHSAKPLGRAKSLHFAGYRQLSSYSHLVAQESFARARAPTLLMFEGQNIVVLIERNLLGPEAQRHFCLGRR